MSETCTPQPTVVRNERGLSINGTRITLYRLMDLIHAGQSPEEIREWLALTEQQVTDALEYIDEHRAEVEAEYELVLKQAEENRRYWEERNREILEKVAALPPKPEYAEALARLKALKTGEAAAE
jgi:uncharacterized protein (DUF433 family)